MIPASWSNPRSRLLRHGRHSRPGGIYLVTFTTYRRQCLFSSFDASCLASRILADASNWPCARLLAWVLMPDHWHGLIELQGEESLSRGVSRAKAAATRQWNRERSAAGSLWARGYHDHSLRREESLAGCARYIVLNPVRAGLVSRCGDYPFWDAIWLP
jgi:REP element-mobilizing transposase RayT